MIQTKITRKTEPESSEKFSDQMVRKLQSSVRAVWSDEMMLTAISMRRQGYGGSQIARELGVSRSAVVGALHRIECDDRRTPDLCRKPKNKDGGAGPEWLIRGLDAQKARAA